MIVRKTLRNILIGVTCLAIPGAVVGGYFGMSSVNPYYKYYRTPITGDNQGFISAYLSAQYLGAKAIVAPGFTHKSPIEALYNSNKANEVKDLGFVLLDEAIDYEYQNFQVVEKDGKPVLSKAIRNTASITFRADLGSIQTGIAVCQFLNDNVDTFGPNLTFGMYGGLPFSSVTCFMGGMQRGIEWFNKNVVGKTNANTSQPYKKISIVEPDSQKGTLGWDKEKKNLIYSPGNFAVGFGPGDGDSIIKDYLQVDDLDVFMPIAGPQLWTAQKKIMELDKHTVLIGVDSACELDPLNQPLKFTDSKGNQVGNGKYVQFSSIKNLAKATDNILTILNNGNKAPDPKSTTNPTSKAGEVVEAADPYENFCDVDRTGGLGTVSVGDISNGCVGVSVTGQPFLQDALKAAGSEPDLSNNKASEYNTPSQMYYLFGKDEGLFKSYSQKDLEKLQNFTWYSDLRQEFKNVLGADYYQKDTKPVEPLNLSPNNQPFIKKGDQADDNLIKLVLSDPTSILFDGSFAESSYNGIVQFYDKNDIKIPSRKEAK